MKLVQRWILGLAAVLALSGCIKVDQTLSINSDGSGTLDMKYGMSEQTLAQIEAVQQMAAGMNQQGMEMEVESDSPLDFDEAEIRKKFAEDNPEGVKLLNVASESREDWKFMQVKLAFDDLDSLKKTEFFEDSDLTITKNPDGNYVLSQKLGSGEMGMPGAGGGPSVGSGEGLGSGPGGGSAMEQQMMEGMAAMMAGLRIAMTVVVPSKVVETNATKVEGNRASWIYDIEEDPQILSKMDKQEDMRVVFSGEGLDL